MIKEKVKKYKVLIAIMAVALIVFGGYKWYINNKYIYNETLDHISYRITEDGTLYISGDYNKQKLKGGFNNGKYTREYKTMYPLAKRAVISLRNTTTLMDVLVDMQEIESVDFSGTNMSNITNMSSVFWGCKKLKQVDMSGWDVSKARNIGLMFGDCYSLTEICGLENLVFENCIYYSGLFHDCSSLKSIKINNSKDLEIINCNTMFCGCTSLEYIDLSDFYFYGLDKGEFPASHNMRYMFDGCTSLKKIIANESFKIIEENYEGELPTIIYVK